MPAPKIRADHDQLNQIASRFGRQASDANKSLKRVKGQIDTLRGGDWVGKGASAFYNEMDSELLPALTRLASALYAAQKVTDQISKIMQGAEDEAARILAVIGATAGGAAGVAGSAGAEGLAAGADAGSQSMLQGLKGFNFGLDVTGLGMMGLGKLASNIANNLSNSAQSARRLMAGVFSIGGEDALKQTGIAEYVANATTDAARAGRVSDWIGKAGTGVDVVGTAGDTLEQAMQTSAQTWLGKLTSTGAAGGFSWAARNNPVVAIGDVAGGFLGVDTPSGIWNASVESITVTTEGLLTGESGGMAALHQKQLNGDWGPLFREAAEAGDFWAENGVLGGLGMAWDAVAESF